MQTPSDEQLHELAHKRVEFRRHLLVFFVVNGAFWILWYFTGRGYMWPVWPLTGWGIGLIFHYLFDYRSARLLSEEEEFRRLKKDLEKHQQVS